MTAAARFAGWAALGALAVVPYLRSLEFPLMHDDRTRLDSPWLAREAGPIEAFRRDFWYDTRHQGSDLYRPVTIVALSWNQRLVPSRMGFRATSAALHAAVVLATAAWLVWTFRRLGGFPDGRARAAAWIGASLFAVHPLGSEAVFWAVGRAEILAAAFLWTVPPLASAVTGNALFPIGTIAADRLAYLPLAGWCGLAGWALAAIPGDAWRRAVPAAALVGALAARTWVRAGDYRDLETYHEATASASPRAVKALANVGRTRLKLGRAAAAVEPLRRAVEIWPEYARARELLAEAEGAAKPD